MKQLPPFVQEKMQPRLKVIWSGRRATLEVVAEVSEAIFRTYLLAGFAYNVAKYTDLDENGGFYVAIAIVFLFLVQKAFVEVMMWRNEIYVVARDEVNGGGRIYKFFGWLSKRYIDEAITPQSPTILPEQPWYWRLWGWTTGEQMMKVKLASVNHVFIEGKKISPQFESAIKFIRGYKPPKEDLPATSLANLGYLRDAQMSGLITDQRFLQDAVKAVIMRNVYGD